MDERKTNDGATARERRDLMSNAGFEDDFAEQRSRIEQMVADPSRPRDAAKNAEIRKLAEDLKERVPADRQTELAPFFKGIEDRLSDEGPPTGEAGAPSALDTSSSITGSALPTGGRQP